MPRRADASPQAAESCPFCEGREDRTPAEVWADRPGEKRPPDTPGWNVRSVPNLFPALAEPPGEGSRPPESGGGFSAPIDPLSASRRVGGGDQFRSEPAAGAHEVIVNSPAHATSLLDLDEVGFAAAVEGWRVRSAAHPDASYVHLIVNEGPDAGASLEHSHAQLYALGFVPAEVARERERASAYHERTMGGDLLTDIAVDEIRRRDRLVLVDDGAILICPWASRSPFHLRVIPRQPRGNFADSGAVLAPILRAALQGLGSVFDGLPQFNLWVRTAPRGIGRFVWHAEIVPRLTVAAGFELGTGVDINVYPPERAAADLRAALA